MKVFKSKTFWIVMIIAFSGFILRLMSVDKPEGLWNDEYLSWLIASYPGKKFIINIFDRQCNMPLYYLYLKFFIHFFGNSDLMLRLTSVLPGVLSIFSMYFVGKEFDSRKLGNKLGIICATMTSLSSFLIYYSQEVRFYTLLFLFSSLSLLFAIRLCRKQSILNITFFMLFNFLILITHTIGFVFVFLILIFVTAYLVKSKIYVQNAVVYKNKIPLKIIFLLWGALILILIMLSPLIYDLLTSNILAQWWGTFTFAKIGFLITDYFSPILTNLINAPSDFFYRFSFEFIIFALIPSLIAIIGFIKALKAKEYKVWGLFFVVLGIILVVIFASLTGKLVFITRYTIETYPILILLVAYGLLKFNKKYCYFLIFIFCSLSLFYILTNPKSAPRIKRTEGHKILADLLKSANLGKKDIIFMTYYSEFRFQKYYDFTKCKRVITFTKATLYNEVGPVTKDRFKNLSSKDIKKIIFSKRLSGFLTARHFENHKIVIVRLKSVAMFNPEEMHKIRNNKGLYDRIPLMFLIFSQINNDIIDYCLDAKNLRYVETHENGDWSITVFKTIY